MTLDRSHKRSVGVRLRRLVLERDGGRCRYCGEDAWRCTRRSRGARIHIFAVDHVVPVLAGGLTLLDNLVLACERCNLRKKGRTPEQAGMVLRPPVQEAVGG